MADNLASVSMTEGVIPGLFAKFTKPKPMFNHSICTGCAECERLCPAHVISMKNNRPLANLDGCIRCFCCQELCPSKAVRVKRLPQALRPFLYIVQFILAGIMGGKPDSIKAKDKI